MPNLSEIAKKMNARGFFAEVCGTGEQAKARVMELLEGARSVGMGGSITMRQIGVNDAVAASGREFFGLDWVAKHDREHFDFDEVARRALFADAYLASANAVTETGCLVNIDGRGNRIAAMAYGPKRLIIVAGKNKVVKNPIEAVARIKRDSCPKNGHRLRKQTPCALEGRCDESRCTAELGKMCNIVMNMEHPPTSHEVFVILVDEELGF